MNDPMTPIEWEKTGFGEVHEIVPNRIYEISTNDLRTFRIHITRAVFLASTIEWNSSIDELLDVRDESGQRVHAWCSPTDIASRHLGKDPNSALRDAVGWLMDYAQVTPTGPW